MSEETVKTTHRTCSVRSWSTKRPPDPVAMVRAEERYRRDLEVNREDTLR